jgi:hypothetical protein
MSQSPNDGASLLDPFGIWKQTRDANLDAWAKFMVDIVNSDEYSQATGNAMSQALALSQPFRQALERMMTNTLAAINMPSRAEVASIAEREVNIEFRLDDLDAKLSTMQKALVASVQQAVQDTVREVVQESVKDAVRQAMATPTRHLRDIETHLAAVDAKVQALQEALRQAPAPGPAGAPPAAEKPQES